MKTMLTALVLALGAQAMVAQAQQAPAVAPAADKQVFQRALVLAGILNSEALIVGDAKSDAQAMELVQQIFAANTNLAAFEKLHPGIGREMAAVLFPILNKSAHDRLPQLWDRQARLYAANFTAPELDILIQFYGSPTGQKMIRIMSEQMKLTHSMAEMKKNDDFRLSAGSVLADVKETVPAVVEELDDADKAALMKLMATGLLPKLKALALQTQKIALDWYDESAPGEEEAIEAALAQVLARYEEKK